MVPHAPMLTNVSTAPTTALTTLLAQTMTVVTSAPVTPATPVTVSTAKMMTSAPTHHVPRVPSAPTMQEQGLQLFIITYN